jgi:glycosyltransferase involved in cell wall biosynthesis
MTATAGLRIEMILPALPRAGMEMVAATLARSLVGHGHEVGFTCIEGPGLLGLELREQGFRVAVVPAPGLWPNVLPRGLATWLKEVGPDIAHIHSGVWLKAAQAARLAGVPGVVYTLHGIAPAEPWIMRTYNRVAAFRTDILVAVSDSLRQYLIERVGVPAEKVRLIHNGISTTAYRKQPRSPEFRHSLGIPAEAVIIGNVARLHPVKNHDLLLAAFQRVLRRTPGAYLLLVGDGQLRQHVEQTAEALQLAGRVCIAGLVPDTQPYLNEMDVFALSSHIEGTSMSILEAMACEVPVVATAVGGNPRLLRDGDLGLLTPAGDADALAAAITTVLQHPDATTLRTAAARQAVEQHYSEARMAADYEVLYTGTGGAARHEGTPAGMRTDG